MGWRDGPGQAARVAEAVRTAKTKKEAARRLGMSRMHLYRLILRSDGVTVRDSVTPGDNATANPPSDTVTPSLDHSLTYGRIAPSFRNVESEAGTEVKEVSVELPLELCDWLDDEAHLRKRAERRSRAAKSPIVIEALRRLREELQREREGQGGEKP